MKHMNVNWLHVPVQMMTAEQINEFLDKTKVKFVKPDQGKRITSWAKIRGNFFRIGDEFFGYSEKTGFFKLYRSANDEVFEENGMSPGDAFEILDKEFQALYGTTIKLAFKPTNHHNEYRQVKLCVPSPINWASRIWKDKKLKYVKKADVSSAYSDALCEDIPTWEKCKVCQGEVEPNEEYPFAFYDNKHIKIYENGSIISTYELMNNKYYMTSDTKTVGKMGEKGKKRDVINRFENFTPTQTILCKKANYSFRPIMEKFYDNRKDNEVYKFIMCSGIGMFHRNQSPQYSNIAAVVIFRTALKMVRRLEYLETHGCCPLLVNTDSISWLGDDISLTSKTKTLGAFFLEYENCEMYISSVKAYQVKDGDKVMTYWAGVKDVKHKNIPFGEIKNKNFTEGYFWDDEEERFVLKGVFMA